MEASISSPPVQVRYVNDAPTLKAMSDPLRLAILNVLMDRTTGQREWSVREIGEHLGEPLTKLYRHVKILLTARLIRVTGTRLVAGNLESRYQTAQISLRIDEGFLRGSELVDDTLQALDALWNRYHDDLFAALRTDRNVPPPARDPARIRPSLIPLKAAIPPERAREFRDRLLALAQEFASLDSDPTGVRFSVLIALFEGNPSDGP